MVQAVTLDEVGNFLNFLLTGFGDYIYMAFVFMSVFSICFFIKNLVVGRQ